MVNGHYFSLTPKLRSMIVKTINYRVVNHIKPFVGRGDFQKIFMWHPFLWVISLNGSQDDFSPVFWCFMDWKHPFKEAACAGPVYFPP